MTPKEQAEKEVRAWGCSRREFNTRFHLLSDSQGIPLAVHLSAGQRHQSTFFATLMTQVRLCNAQGRPRRDAWPEHGAWLQQGYSYPSIRRWLRDPRIQGVNPERSDQRRSHRRAAPYHSIRSFIPGRNAVERCAGRLKEYRRIATRYDKLAANFLARVNLARTRPTKKSISRTQPRRSLAFAGLSEYQPKTMLAPCVVGNFPLRVNDRPFAGFHDAVARIEPRQGC